MKKSLKYVSSICMALLICFIAIGNTAYASEDEEYITISVDAVDDNEGSLQYALDTDDPSAFSSSNEFYVRTGTSHTIYVKDAAGNITSQEFNPGYSSSVSSTTSSVQIEREVNENDRTVNIDVFLDDKQETDYSDYEYAGDLLYDPAEEGQGEVYDRIITDTSDTDAERLFYTFSTKEGEVFYLMIDQGRSNNNVYLLDQVTLSDLSTLAVDDSRTASSEESNSLLSIINNSGSGDESAKLETETSQKSKENSSNFVFIILLAAVGGGVYYYMKVYKNKKNEQMDLVDAMDKEDFIAGEEDEEEDEAEFGLESDYQDKIMQQLINEDDEELPADEEDIYATSHEERNDEASYVISQPDEDKSVEFEEEEEEEDEDDDEF